MKTDNDYTVFSVIEKNGEIEKLLIENGYTIELLAVFDSEIFYSEDSPTYIYADTERKVYSTSKILSNKTSKQKKILHFYYARELFLFMIGITDKNYYVTKEPIGSVNYPESYITAGGIIEMFDEEAVKWDYTLRKATREDIVKQVETWTKE
jgi:hypothetical protein